MKTILNVSMAIIYLLAIIGLFDITNYAALTVLGMLTVVWAVYYVYFGLVNLYFNPLFTIGDKIFLTLSGPLAIIIVAIHFDRQYRQIVKR